MRSAGFLAAIPELTQTEVNHLARGYFIALLVANTDVKDRLTGLYALLRARSDMLKSAFHLDIGSPLLFAEILSGCEDSLYERRGELLEGLRLVPTQQAFQGGQLEYYAVSLRAQYSPDGWLALAGQLTG
jgi:intracellular multiplication protein IcmJ